MADGVDYSNRLPDSRKALAHVYLFFINEVLSLNREIIHLDLSIIQPHLI
jgi:hypothetical protein